MTRFLCQELLYEYVRGALTAERQSVMDQFIGGCSESRREMEKLQRGLGYVEKAASIQVSQDLHQALLNFEPVWKKRLRAWSLWSSQRGWRMLPYFFLLVALGLGLWVTKPWEQQLSQVQILAEQAKLPTVLRSSGYPEAFVTVLNPSTPSPLLPKKNFLVQPQTRTEAPASDSQESHTLVQNEKSEGATNQSDRALKGFLMRGEIFVNDFASDWPKIREKIQSLGGKVAGHVPLGWLRNPKNAYFHFSLPQSNRAELENFISTFGQVRFSEEEHPRVMPQGQVRIILSVKDGVTHETPSAAP